MPNHFGDDLSTGPRGPPGKNAVEILKWFPDSVLEMYRKSEIINLNLERGFDVVIYDKDNVPIALKNYGQGPDAYSIGKFPTIVKILDHYVLDLHNLLLVLDPINIGGDGTTVIIALTFRSQTLNLTPRFVYTNESGTLAMSVKRQKHKSENILTIYSGEAKKEIEFNGGEWNGLIIQYKFEMGILHCKYHHNSKTGFLPDASTSASRKIYLGGAPTAPGIEYLSIGSYETRISTEGFLPEFLCNLLMKDIILRVDSAIKL